VGAYGDDDFGDVSGSAYVFRRSGTTWTQEAKLYASDAAMGHLFGQAVALDGDTALIASSEQNASAGAVYVFTRSGTVWTQQAKLTAADAGNWKLFGSAVDIEVDTAVIGSSNDSLTDWGAGSAYIFRRSGTVWSQEQKLLASDGAAYDEFGNDVAISGDAVVISARLDDTTYSDTGSAYVFRFSGGSWAEEAKLVRSTVNPNEYSGTSVDLLGDIVVMGSPYGGGSTGAVYVFQYDPGGMTWTESDMLVDSAGGSNDYLGQSVSLSGSRALGGAWGDGHYNEGPGSAFVFGLGCGGCATVAASLSCVPDNGVLPFSSAMTVTLDNAYPGQTRRMAARIDLTLGNGSFYPNWRVGFTNIAAGGSYITAWSQALPLLGSLVGNNLFQLVAEDVTPSPYNQPPYPAAGDTCSGSCTVVGVAP